MDENSVAPATLERIEILRDSVLDLDTLADEKRRLLLHALDTYRAAVEQRDRVAHELAEAIDAATRDA